MSELNVVKQASWMPVCTVDDLVPNSGVCALLDGQQIAIFYLPDQQPAIYGVSNWDPLGQANVISRGIVGSIEGGPVIASPLYKQHFSLSTGQCIEEADYSLQAYNIRVVGQQVEILVPA